MPAEKNRSLREYMRECGLTYQRAAYMLDMSESTLYRFFRRDLTGAQVSEVLFLCNFYRDNNRIMTEILKKQYQEVRKKTL